MEDKAKTLLSKSSLKTNYIYILIIITAFAVYINTLFNEFVFDDVSLVVTNPWIRDIKYTPEIFSSGAWSFEGRDSNYYRPMIHVIYMLIYYTAGLKSSAFHLANIIFHTAASLLVFLIAAKLSGNNLPFRYLSLPLATAMMFATHPVHTEAVAWVVGMFDLSFTFFYLLSFYLYIQSEQKFNMAYIISVASFFLSALCKEPALTLPVILAAYDYSMSGKSWKTRNIWARYIPYAAVVVVYLVLRYNALGGFFPIEALRGMGLYDRLINIVVLFSDYMGKLFIPINLNAWHVFTRETSMATARGIISISILGAFLFLLWLSAKKNRLIFLSLLMIAVPLLPALYISALTQGNENVFAERYLYLPSFGFTLLAGIIIEALAEKKQNRFTLTATILSVITIFYSAGTISRNFAWKDNYTLWSDSVKKSPNSAKAHELLGFALLKNGKTEDGKQHLQRALELNPDLLNETISKGTGYAKKGFLNKAVFEFVAAIAIKPDSAEAHFNLAIAYDSLGWSQMAIDEYKKTLILSPKFAEAHNNLGILYSIAGSLDEALSHFQEAVRLDPYDPSFHYNLARAYDMKGFSDLADSERKLAQKLERK
ncbi:MAG: tetratricopeptide repeat protein [Candidatus Schekmanbacteria bacterium]|nr:tetratricopeptide repeat protein [Candidatus Schekmanbacteria bacterium]